MSARTQTQSVIGEKRRFLAEGADGRRRPFGIFPADNSTWISVVSIGKHRSHRAFPQTPRARTEGRSLRMAPCNFLEPRLTQTSICYLHRTIRQTGSFLNAQKPSLVSAKRGAPEI